MVKTLARGRQYMTDACWSAVGFASAAILSIHPVFATGTGTSTIWNRFSTILQDIYGQVVAISTIVAVTVGAIALLIRMISRNQRAIDMKAFLRRASELCPDATNTFELPEARSSVDWLREKGVI